MPKMMPRPRLGFSLACIDAAARSLDWSELPSTDGRDQGEPYNVVYPRPTYAEWRENDDSAPTTGKHDKRLSDAEWDTFREADGYYEWEDGFAPMMSYAWPVTLAYEVTAEDAAAAMAEHGPACSLIELTDWQMAALFGEGSDAPEYVIALNGGGINLADNIAAAYLACGCVPPLRILDALAGVVSQDAARRMRLREAYKTANDYLRNKSSNLRREASRIFTKGAR